MSACDVQHTGPKGDLHTNQKPLCLSNQKNSSHIAKLWTPLRGTSGQIREKTPEIYKKSHEREYEAIAKAEKTQIFCI